MEKKIISRPKELPKTKITWWAMILGLCTVLVPTALALFTSVIRPLIDKVSSIGAPIGFVVGIVSIALVPAAIITGIIAFRKGERSWVLWVGFIPAILSGVFWGFMFIGELLFPH